MPPFFFLILVQSFIYQLKSLYCHGSECQGMLIKSLCLIVVYKSGYLPELCICIISGQIVILLKEFGPRGSRVTEINQDLFRSFFIHNYCCYNDLTRSHPE